MARSYTPGGVLHTPWGMWHSPWRGCSTPAGRQPGHGGDSRRGEEAVMHEITVAEADVRRVRDQIVDVREGEEVREGMIPGAIQDRKSTRLNSSHVSISYA